NDLFFREYTQYSQKVRDFYHIPKHTKILLYAPSFRDYEKEDMRNEAQQIIEQFNDNDNEKWICICRTHYFRTDSILSLSEENIFNGNIYFEMQDLLCAADILVTDFSSSMWDFALTGRPVIRYEKNIRKYEENERGFFIPRCKWPFPVTENLSDIYKIFSHLDITEYKKNVATHLQWMGSYEQGIACMEISKIIYHHCYKELDHEYYKK
ncbi:MAG: CDP-glycerol glycerophosphotransferase family protein, partial [Ruminococcus flavefaciens]|nr:CDP-glycerol glycerophosphotransferase family protein [Ruminococcus flavefaciens]